MQPRAFDSCTETESSPSSSFVVFVVFRRSRSSSSSSRHRHRQAPHQLGSQLRTPPLHPTQDSTTRADLLASSVRPSLSRLPLPPTRFEPLLPTATCPLLPFVSCSPSSMWPPVAAARLPS
jgi:hypothetical protein